MTLPNWDLNEFYSSFTSDEINKDIKTLQKKANDFSRKFKGKLKSLKKKHLLQTLMDYEKIEELVQKIKSFAYLTYCTDQLNEKKKKFYQLIEESMSEIDKMIIFYGIELNSLNEKKLSIFSETKYKNWIINHKKFKKFQKSEDNEKILVEKSLTSSSAWIKFFDQSMTRLKFRFNGNDLSETEILNLLTSPDQKIRKQAAKVFGNTLKDNIFNFSFIINTISKDLDIEKNIRGFEHSESSRHLLNQIEKSDVDSLVKTTTENYSKICHRYYKYKNKYFIGEKLKYWDRNAPYPNTKDFKITWKQAKDIVLDSYYAFDKRFGDIVKLFFENNWIDARVSKGKTSGAFSHPTVPSCSPRILLNFQGKIRDVMTLAHELGHGVHQYLANKNGLLLADTPLTLAETASVFGEMLTFKSLITKSKNKEEKIYLLRSKIEDMLNTVFRQIAFFKFERDLHNKRIEGELTEDEICSIWMDSQKESLGNNVELSGEYKYFWAYIPHFIHSPFYVYAYAFGDCLVNSLYSKYENGQKDFNDKYFNLLQSGGSEHYQKHLKKFNLDPKDKNFWQLGMNLIKNLIDDLEQLS
mgnify:CR=1 FL=1|tara:strand:- start:627 stop:2372 length:1746 start_codon:yes stop_codon:yes gene_type:complete